MALEQLHYWLDRATKAYAGRKWVYKTYADWGQELALTEKQARSAFDGLRSAGLVESISNPHNRVDRTLWWSINQDMIALLDQLVAQNEAGVSPTDDLRSKADGQPSGADGLPSRADGSAARGRAIPESTDIDSFRDYKPKRPARVRPRENERYGDTIRELSKTFATALVDAGRKQAKYLSDWRDEDWLYPVHKLTRQVALDSGCNPENRDWWSEVFRWFAEHDVEIAHAKRPWEDEPEIITRTIDRPRILCEEWETLRNTIPAELWRRRHSGSDDDHNERLRQMAQAATG